MKGGSVGGEVNYFLHKHRKEFPPNYYNAEIYESLIKSVRIDTHSDPTR